jgi:hypothetical protein
MAHVARAPAMVVPDQPSDPPYVDDRELERRTPIRRITWQTWRRQGVGPPYYRARRRCVYRWVEVVAWLESHRVGGAAGADLRSAGS